jgi:hypothetical protein
MVEGMIAGHWGVWQSGNGTTILPGWCRLRMDEGFPFHLAFDPADLAWIGFHVSSEQYCVEEAAWLGARNPGLAFRAREFDPAAT